MENSEWPDADRLKELRQAGEFPYSRLSARCITTIVLLAATFLQLGTIGELFETIRSMMIEPVTNFAGVKAKLPELADKLEAIFIIYCAAYILSFLPAVLVQSRFYFSLVNLSFNLSQVLRIKNLSFKFFAAVIFRGIFGILLGLVIGFALFYWSSRQFLQIVFSDAFYGKEGFQIALLTPVLKSVFIISILVLLAISAVSYLIVRFNFMIKHKRADRFEHGS